MAENLRTRGEQLIEQLMAELDPASERYRVLAVAKRFKASWVELGEELLKVSSEGLYRQWGYDSFEAYCSREVRIRKPTAEKLTLAYRYLEKEEPELLARRSELKPLPDYRSVDLLRRAREEQQLPAEDYAQLRRAVIEEERSHPTVLKRFRETTQAVAGEDGRRPLQEALAAARRLCLALKSLPDLPGDPAGATARLVILLEERLQALQED